MLARTLTLALWAALPPALECGPVALPAAACMDTASMEGPGANQAWLLAWLLAALAAPASSAAAVPCCCRLSSLRRLGLKGLVEGCGLWKRRLTAPAGGCAAAGVTVAATTPTCLCCSTA